MDSRDDDIGSELKDVQIDYAWIPTTPAKPDSIAKQPICCHWEEKHLVDATWVEANAFTGCCSETGQLSKNLVRETQCQEMPACLGPVVTAIGFNYRQAGDTTNSQVHGDSRGIHDKFALNNRWNRMSYVNLLAIAEAGGTSATAENAISRMDCIAIGFHPQNNYHYYTISSENSSVVNQDSFPEENFEDEMSSTPNVNSGGSTISSRSLFQHNISSETIADSALVNSVSLKFEPITPEKTSITEERLDSALQVLTTDGEHTEKGAHRNNLINNGLKEFHMKEKQSHSWAMMSTMPSENQKPDKEGTKDAELSKTHNKPRKKKHRPKVIIEGQPKNTPKPSAEEPTFFPETTSVKRKYNRKKRGNDLANTSSEGDKNEMDADKEPSGTEDTPTAKRKYARKKEIDKPEDTILDVENTSRTERKTVQLTRSSRRSLNFELEGQEKDERTLYCPSNSCMKLQAEHVNAEDRVRATVQCREEKERIEKRYKGIADELTRCMNPVKRDYLSMPERNSQSPLPHKKTGSRQYDYILTDQPVSTKGTCKVVLSDVTPDKEANTVQVAINLDGQMTPKNVNGSNCGDSVYLNPEKQVRDFKRQHTDTAVEANIGSTNTTGIYHNSMQTYSSVLSQNSDKNDCTSSMQSVAYKKTRIDEEQHTAKNCLSSTMSTSCNHVKLRRNGFSSLPQRIDDNLPTDNPATTGNLNVQKNSLQLAFRPTYWIEHGRYKVSTRVQYSASGVEIYEQTASPSKGATVSRSDQGFETLHQSKTCMGALEVDVHSTTPTHKQPGQSLAFSWRYMSPLDAITEKLNQLDLNAEQHALVPYQRVGDVIPFDSSFREVRRRRPRPKVELDDETTRVWKLLLENINSEGIDGTDEENTKWWEEERRVFSGRADTFIARMHLVQGDRRFSPWKGSVLDSVIGVFLTQNVSDHLSSSAFMSLAAHFPIEPNAIPAKLHKERANTNINKDDIGMMDLDEHSKLNRDMFSKTISDYDMKILHHCGYNEMREINSVKFLENRYDGILEDNLRGQFEDIFKQGPVTTHKPVANKWVSMIEDKRNNNDALSSQPSMISKHSSKDSPVVQTTERTESSSRSTLEEEPISWGVQKRLTSITSFVKLLQMARTLPPDVYEESMNMFDIYGRQNKSESLSPDMQRQVQCDYCTYAETNVSCSKSTLHAASTPAEQESECIVLSQKRNKFSGTYSGGLSREKVIVRSTSLESKPQNTSQMSTTVSFKERSFFSAPCILASDNDQIEISTRIVVNQRGPVAARFQENNRKTEATNNPNYPQNLMDATSASCNRENSRSEPKEINLNKNDGEYQTRNEENVPKPKAGRIGKLKQDPTDWDSLRRHAQTEGRKRERTVDTMDSVDWDAVRCADVNDIAHTIIQRGMNNILAERVKDFLNRLVREHGSLDLEWLRDVPPDRAKEYLLSVKGLGLKSVECVRLLTLHQLAFPVDTNVGRIAVRLGWVPLQPLPESLQLHLLELYPVLESIQKYLWPRLCRLDQRTLYELHYQLITFGKVFCTKSKPNCNACPMRGECRHFASAFASARLALPAPEKKSITTTTGNNEAYQNSLKNIVLLQFPLPQGNQMATESEVNNSQPIIEEPATPESDIEVPTFPKPSHSQVSECNVESHFSEDPDELPSILLNMKEFAHNLKNIIQESTDIQKVDTSKALVALTPEAAIIPMPKLKNASQLRTEHQVYELPDSHPLLEELDKRVVDDPCPYLLAIWTPGETMNSIKPPERRCSSQEPEKLCTDETCLSCNCIREANSRTVRGTLLIPCRTAMRGSFPLNGTYFQVNEVFSDHDSSLHPMDIPRELLWNLPRRTVYFGTSIPTIFKGLSTEGIQHCFWRGFVCIRGFDRKTRAPRPLIARLHFPASKLGKEKGKTSEN